MERLSMNLEMTLDNLPITYLGRWEQYNITGRDW